MTLAMMALLAPGTSATQTQKTQLMVALTRQETTNVMMDFIALKTLVLHTLTEQMKMGACSFATALFVMMDILAQPMCATQPMQMQTKKGAFTAQLTHDATMDLLAHLMHAIQKLLQRMQQTVAPTKPETLNVTMDLLALMMLVFQKMKMQTKMDV